ncbi:hypothetical protein, conserved [Leishmania donovani]|uniref:Uncharacterized protein n=1 Tax=Leishmania donovani TaxID=5661 RepID=E9BKW4_LEIDO|nr:hypothetical protein, conserved [Leishmania donovani]CBZ35892.1 hypothetical protein, conserved [Leishmania donovani]
MLRMMPVFSGASCVHLWGIPPRPLSLSDRPLPLSFASSFFFLIWCPLSCPGYVTRRCHKPGSRGGEHKHGWSARRCRRAWCCCLGR